jgi:hypothetical protein
VLIAVLAQAALGSALMALGSWGATNAPRLLAGRHGPDDEEQVVRPYMRGALTCRIAGTALLALAALVLIDALV